VRLHRPRRRAPAPGRCGQRRKRFFFEKKKQKTFVYKACWLEQAGFKDQKFFGSFFQKRTSLPF
jgi:hypothetical protein